MQKEQNYNIKSIQETVALIKEYDASLVRFGDGEFDLIEGKGIPYQEYNQKLSLELKKILQIPSHEQFLVGIPDVFQNLERYNSAAQNFWKGRNYNYSELLSSRWYVTTFVSRPYIDWVDKNEAEKSFESIQSLWAGKDVLIVEGETSRSGVGNDLFQHAQSLSRIVCPSRNAFNKYDEIFRTVKKYGQGKIILLMLGPTAKVLAYELYQEGFQVLDIGHIDSEYEWFKMKAKYKVKLPNKHTAEHNYDQDIVFDEDQEYQKSILETII